MVAAFTPGSLSVFKRLPEKSAQSPHQAAPYHEMSIVCGASGAPCEIDSTESMVSLIIAFFGR